MIRIAICDDEAPCRALLKEYCEQFFAHCSVDYATDAEYSAFSNAVDLLHATEEGVVFDLIFFDIYMAGISGVEAARELRASDSSTRIVFVTSSSDRAVDAFALHADDYLVKPFEYSRFEECMKRCISLIDTDKKSILLFKTRLGLRKIDFRSIAYSETDSHQQVLHLVDGETLSSRMTSSKLFEMFEGDPRFFKAGASYIVNLDNIHAIEGRDVQMLGGTTIQVPVRTQAALNDAYFARCFDLGTSNV